jgi:hypothetical protein
MKYKQASVSTAGFEITVKPAIVVAEYRKLIGPEPYFRMMKRRIYWILL